MPASNSCWGIEIGAFAIKAVKVELDGTDVRLVDYAVIPHAKVLSTPDIKADDVVRVSLGALVSQYDLSKSQIAVSIPGHAAFARFAKLPPVEPKKVPDIVKFEAMQQIPFPLEQVEWDYQTFITPDSPEIEVGIFAISKEKIAERLALLEDVNLHPDYLTISPIAVYNAMAYDLDFGEKTPGTIIVDVGTTSTDLVIFEPGRIWVRTFPIGGHHFTEALVNAFKLGYPKAEKLKLEAPESKHARHAFQAMRAVFTDLGQDIQRSIQYYQSLHKDAKLQRLIGVGSTFHIPGLRKYLKQQLGMEVYRVEEFKKLKIDGLGGEDRQNAFRSAALNLVTVYGLALRGLGLAAINADLMPITSVRETMWSRKNKWFALAAGLAIAAGGAMFIRPLSDHYAVLAMEKPRAIDETTRVLREVRSHAEQAGVVGTANSDFRAANLAALLDRKDYYGYVVADLSQLFGDADKLFPQWWRERASKIGASPAQPPPTAFTLTRFDTNYLAPGVVPGEEPGARDRDVRRGPSGARDRPRIQVTLRMTTTAPDPQEFVIEAVERWLKANESRPGVPYRLVSGSPAWRVERITPAAATPGQPGGETAPPGPAPGRVRPGQRDDRSPPPIQGILVGGGSQEGQSADQLASLDALRDAMQPAQPTANITVEWICEILPPAEDRSGGPQ